MKIRFPFRVITTNDPHVIEIMTGSHGELPLPQIEMRNAEEVSRAYKLNDSQMDNIGDKAAKTAIAELVKETISIEM